MTKRAVPVQKIPETGDTTTNTKVEGFGGQVADAVGFEARLDARQESPGRLLVIYGFRREHNVVGVDQTLGPEDIGAQSSPVPREEPHFPSVCRA